MRVCSLGGIQSRLGNLVILRRLAQSQTGGNRVNPVHFRPRRRNRESQLSLFHPYGARSHFSRQPSASALGYVIPHLRRWCIVLLLIRRSLLSKADEVARGVLHAQLFRSIERVVHSNRKVDALESGDDLFQIGNFDI